MKPLYENLMGVLPGGARGRLRASSFVRGRKPGGRDGLVIFLVHLHGSGKPVAACGVPEG